MKTKLLIIIPVFLVIITLVTAFSTDNIQANWGIFNDNLTIGVNDTTFYVNGTNGQVNNLLIVNGTEGSIKIGHDETSIEKDEGIITVTGTYNPTAPFATLDFMPTIKQGSAFIGIYFRPHYNSSGSMTGLRLSPSYTTLKANKALTLLDFQAGTNIADKDETTSIYTEAMNRQIVNVGGSPASTGNIDNQGIGIGGKITYVDFVTGAGDYTENMITLTGGVQTYLNSGAGTVTQKGLKYTGFGSVSSTPVGNIEAMTADGGLFSHTYDCASSSKIRFGAGNDASLCYDGTDLVIDASVVGTGGIKVNDAYTLPKTDGTQGQIITTDGTGTTTWNNHITKDTLSFETYDAEPSRSSETNVHGGMESIATAQPLSSGTNITAIKGTGKVLIIINTGSDIQGSMTITGSSVDRNTGSITPYDSDTIPVNSITTDNTDTDTNGNTRHSITDGYISSKWYTGDINITTADLTLTDVDVHHVSFEQFNDAKNITLNTFDVNLFTTNTNAEFDAYLYLLENGNNRANITRIASLNIGSDGETAKTNRYFRLRRGELDTNFNGTTDGAWVDIHYSNSPSYIEDVTLKVWGTSYGVLGE